MELPKIRGHESSRILGSIANYSDRSRPIKLPASNLLKGRIEFVVVSHSPTFFVYSLSLSLLNSPLERYPFPRRLSTVVCNKREIGEAEWRKGERGWKGEPLSENKVTRLAPLPPRFSSQGKGETSALEPTAGAPSLPTRY